MKVIAKRFIIELTHEGIEYHVTISADLRDVFGIDILSFPHDTSKRIFETKLLELIWEAFSNDELNLD